MAQSIKITIIVLGLITIGSGVYSFLKGAAAPVYGFAIFMGLSLIGTAIFTKKVNES